MSEVEFINQIRALDIFKALVESDELLDRSKLVPVAYGDYASKKRNNAELRIIDDNYVIEGITNYINLLIIDYSSKDGNISTALGRLNEYNRNEFKLLVGDVPIQINEFDLRTTSSYSTTEQQLTYNISCKLNYNIIDKLYKNLGE